MMDEFVESEKEIAVLGRKYFVMHGGAEVARAYLYIMKNDLHEKPFGFMEDVFVDEKMRGLGVGGDLVARVIGGARDAGCYKIICASRHERLAVHKLYERIGFKNHGLEFRLDL